MDDLLGAHMSIAGGLHEALCRGSLNGCSVVQIFTSSNRSWHARELTSDDVEKFNRAREETGIRQVVAHNSYLVNLCSANSLTAKRSLKALTEEIVRCTQLGLTKLVIHPGAHTGRGVTEGLRLVAEGIDETLERADGSAVRILLETTAGSGTVLGHRFEQLAEIISLSRHPDRLGVCFDTAHTFAADYDLRTRDGYDNVLEEFDRVLGLGRLECFHFNDSKSAFGSRVDRHEHIGKGKLGIEPFRFILNDTRFRTIPKILETPKGTCHGRSWDMINLATLRGLIS